MNRIYSRQDFMSSKCTYREYYAQFVNNYVIACVRAKYTKEELTRYFKQDKHLNNINMNLIDRFTMNSVQYLAGVNRRLGNGSVYSMSTGCSVFKEACKQIIEGE